MKKNASATPKSAAVDTAHQERRAVYERAFRQSGMSAADYGELFYAGGQNKAQIVQTKAGGSRRVTEAETMTALLLEFLDREGYALPSFGRDKSGRLNFLSKADYALEIEKSEAKSVELAKSRNRPGKLYMNKRGWVWSVKDASADTVTLAAGIKGNGRQIVVTKKALKEWRVAVLRGGVAIPFEGDHG